MEIKAADVKALRDKTGAGMMECKKALTECNGDEEAAIKLLKEKGLAALEKRAERATKEGRIFIKLEGSKLVIAELTCETDFVANNADFIACGEKIVAEAMAKNITSVTDELAELLKDFAAKTRENMSLRRLELVEIPSDCVMGKYVHSDNKTGVVVLLKADPADAAAKELGIEDQVKIEYVYGNQFYGDADIKAYMDTWVSQKVEVIFACGGGIFTSAVDAAKKLKILLWDRGYLDEMIAEGNKEYKY